MTIATSIDVDVFRAAVDTAVLAPSAYNAQPWRFALRAGGIDVRIDPHRLLPVADPKQWAARIACGAAIANIRLSLAISGLTAHVRILPVPGDQLLIATVTAAGSCVPTPRQRALHAAVADRHSNRRPFFDTPVPAEARARLQAAAEDTGAWLSLVADREPVARIAEIVRYADEELHRAAAYVDEMTAWIAHYETDGAGIPPEAAGVAPAGQDLLAMRRYGGPDRAEGRDFETDPLLAIVGTAGHSLHDDIVAGMAMQMVLLTATDARLATSMLSQPIEIPASREQLRRALSRYGTPHMIVRVGYGQPTTGVTSRRSLDAVID